MRPAVAARHSVWTYLLLFVLAICPCTFLAQTTVGIQPYGSYQGTIDQINLADLSLHIDIPLFEHKARGRNMGISVHLIYDNAYFDGNGNLGWRMVAVSAIGGSINGDYTTYNCPPRTDGQNPGTYQQWTYNFVDSTGYQHAFSGNSIYSGCDSIPNPNPTTTLNVYATDGSGYHLVATGYDALVTDPWGTQFHTYIPGTPVITDVNGNFINAGEQIDTSSITVSAGGGSYVTDQYGNPISRNPSFVKYTDAGGNAQEIAINYQLISTVGMPVSVTFPDGSAYHLSYQSGSIALASLQLPSGGSISYQTTISQNNPNNCVSTTLVRSTSDGTTTYHSASTGNAACFGPTNTTVSKQDGSSETIYFAAASDKLPQGANMLLETARPETAPHPLSTCPSAQSPPPQPWTTDSPANRFSPSMPQACRPGLTNTTTAHLLRPGALSSVTLHWATTSPPSPAALSSTTPTAGRR